MRDESPLYRFPKDIDPSEIIFNIHRVGEGELYLYPDPLDVMLAYEHGVENAISNFAISDENVVPISKGKHKTA